MTIGDDTGGAVRWLSYHDAAKALGIKTESIKRIAFRKGWRRQPGNDGRVRLAVPVTELRRPRTGPPHDNGHSSAPPSFPDNPQDNLQNLPPDKLAEAMAAMLAGKREAEARAEAAEARAQEAEARAGAVAADLIRAQAAAEAAEAKAERHRAEAEEARRMGARAEGEAAGLREAVRIAEARGAAAEADQARIRALPWWRRLWAP